jgi:uncharacterized membrane protein
VTSQKAQGSTHMNGLTSIVVLMVAALLESGGDALMRMAIHTPSRSNRLLFFLVAAGVLTAYGWTVNAPPWEFGKLIGLYVVFFFVISQILAWIVFKQQPSIHSSIAALLIVAGGVVYSLDRK